MDASLRDSYPPSPSQLPAGLTSPSPAYRRHAWLAVAGLLAFVVGYLGLTGYLGWTIYRLVGKAALHGRDLLAPTLLSLPSLFFFAFLVRGLFVVKHGRDESLVELSAKEEPRLFAFLEQIARETRAPRPHRIYVSARVNACVFYDLSFWNLLFPSKKNLELGLGLVNALSLDEMKAVVAHEFGHFAQKTMAVGRWVYVAQQVAGHIVASRGAFDRLLTALSTWDIRVAWIGWIARLFVWAIRALLDTLFRIVLLAHRALGKEMELQADRAAVSVSGSDSLIHALHRLGPADEAWDQAVSFAVFEARQGRPVEDLFVLQSQAVAELSRVLDKPDLGRTPPRPSAAGQHRVFKAALAHPPRMWLTHPPNHEREESAKAAYVPSALDARSAWTLFEQPEKLRREATSALLKPVEVLKETPAEGTHAERFARRFARASLDPRYRGAYLGRAIAAYFAEPGAMAAPVEAGGPLPREEVANRLRSLYPPALREALESHREKREELRLLEGLVEGALAAPGGVIRFRGRSLRRKQLPEALAEAKADLKAVEERILTHDRTCRAAHLEAARLVGRGWEAHLEALRGLLHYATHSLRNLSDAHEHLRHVLDIVLADGRVSRSERARLLSAALEVQRALAEVWRTKGQVHLPDDVERHFQAAGGWTALAQELGLPAPEEANLGDWLNAEDGWANGAIADLRDLADAALDALLEAEEKVARWALGDRAQGADGGVDAPAPAQVPSSYQCRVVGDERPRQKKLDLWDRFQTADGFFPGAARAVVASALLFPALISGGHIGASTVRVVNGLGATVAVNVGGKQWTLSPGATASAEVEASEQLHLESRTASGELIEAFDQESAGAFATAVYNVAGAAPLMQYSVSYGTRQADPPRRLGVPRWYVAREDYVLTEPPRSISSKKKGGELRTVLQAIHAPPGVQVENVPNPSEVAALLTAHVRFDEEASPVFARWLALASSHPEARPVLLERAARTPRAVILQRAVQDALVGDEKRAWCARIQAEAAALGDDGDLQYLAIRCQADGPEQEAAFRRAYERHPQNGWLAYAAAPAYAAEHEWPRALEAYRAVSQAPSLAPLWSGAALEAVRTHRAATALGASVTPPPSMRGATLPSEPLGLVRLLEGPPSRDEAPVVGALRALAKGELEVAVTRADPENRPMMLILAAASDGCPARLVEEALALPASEVDGTSAMHLAALALREGRSGKELLARSGLDEAMVDRLASSLVPDRLHREPKALEALASGLPLPLQGQLLAMGTVVLGAEAPEQWRAQAKAMLFPFERPYFR